eukprot:gb/GEZN01006203.1/.p1 GENE.gb/GEZN01006203.1/~~gb/GEZN01006203.1/.p1  ORF type:complete len:502 (+),score=89.97 gb/GEZN01006203.1/:1-1506(+)
MGADQSQDGAEVPFSPQTKTSGHNASEQKSPQKEEQKTQDQLALSELTAVSPIDGRYGSATASLRRHFSEFALIKQRIFVEVKWLQWLTSAEADKTGLPKLSSQAYKFLDGVASDFSVTQALRVKSIEAVTRHDVKAVEYFLKELFQAADPKLGLTKYLEVLHLALTSEDVNNLSYALMVKQTLAHELLPNMDTCIEELTERAHKWANIPLLGRTHGQPASPTTVGKEMAVFAHRLKRQRARIIAVKVMGKVNGAVGNYNAHLSAFPKINWADSTSRFLHSIGLTQNPYTTQIESHDWNGELFHAMQGFNTVLLSCDQDMWGYISREVFRQATVAGEIGSSTMPHKVNPIDFENSEGNLGLANALFGHLASKLPVSRFQRDLTDSTVQRNIGCAFAYCLLAYKNFLRGLGKLTVDEARVAAELNEHWEVLAEPIQTVMRRYDVPEPYEKLKALTRGKGHISKEIIREFVQGLEVPQNAKDMLLAMTPSSYIGDAVKLATFV